MWYLKNDIADGGLHNSESPKYSLLSYRRAINKNKNIKVPLRISKDNVIVVSENKDITDYNIKDIIKQKLENSTQTIPMFNQLLGIVNGKVSIILDIKHSNKDVDNICNSIVISLKHYKGDYVISSSNPYVLKWFKNFNKDITLILLEPDNELSFEGISKILVNFLLVYLKPDVLIYKKINKISLYIKKLFNVKTVIL